MPPKSNAPAGPAAPRTPEEAQRYVMDGLKTFYERTVLPLEKTYRFDAFHSPSLTGADIDAKPLVLFIGPFSTGKSTSIRKLIERDIPGMHIAPEPSTDRFMAIMHGETEREYPGNALAAMDGMPFRGTQQFGMAFLNRFQGVSVNSPILRHLTFIDTPGVLSGAKQRLDRQYDFPAVIEWFAGRSDRILLLFDAHKLDISDELKTAIEALQGNEDKVRVILNKADAVSAQELMRVYGALMWSLARVFKFPEVVRVFVASLWDRPYSNTSNEQLLRAEESDLLADLRALPRNATLRKVNEFVKRARQVKVHAFILSHLRDQFGFFGKESTQKKLLASLPDHFRQVMRERQVAFGDFPNVDRFRDVVKEFKIHEFPRVNPKMIEALDHVLSVLIPNLMKALAADLPPAYAESGAQSTPQLGSSLPANQGPGQSPSYDGAEGRGPGFGGNSHGGSTEEASNPFDEDPDRAEVGVPWAIEAAVARRYHNELYQMRLTSGKLSGAAAKTHFASTGLPNADLRRVWALSDIDQDGFLDPDEFTVASYLVEMRRAGVELPETLPLNLIPPSKRS